MTTHGSSPVCCDTGALLLNGAGCGDALVCSGGTCLPCADNTSCTPVGNPCHGGILNCFNGTPTCVEQPAISPDGTVCGAGLFCAAGDCLPCVGGATCPAGVCLVGEIFCATNGQVCEAIGYERDQSSCGENLVCISGSCVRAASACGNGGGDGGVGCDASGRDLM